MAAIAAGYWPFQPAPAQAPSPVDEAADAVNKLKGLFKF